MMRRLIARWMAVPLEPDTAAAAARIHRAMLVVGPVGGLIHIVLAGLFALLGVWPLVSLNLAFSTPMWTLASWLVRRRNLQAGLAVMYAEVMVHAAAATFVIGWGAGAHLPALFGLGLFGFGERAVPRRLSIGIGLTGLAVWFALFALLRNAVPLHPLSSQVTDQFFVISVMVVMGIPAMLIGGLSVAADNADQALRVAQEELMRERARREALLEQEVGHQVAARSRELGQMLQRLEGAMVVRRLAAGETFDRRYVVQRALGAGGMGVVYEVERTTDGQQLALKIVIGEVSGAHAARFAREAEIGAQLRHPNLVSIVDVGVAEGVPFLVMELASGGSLEERRARFGDQAWALPILAGVAGGLAALHEAGIVHRDLKPANVLFSGRDDLRAKISDFGISRFGAFDTTAEVDPTAATMHSSRRASHPQALTATGALLGTPFYMAPEASSGAEKIDAPADVFALGILACELLTNSAPFVAPPVFLAMANEPLPAPAIGPSLTDASLRAVLTACLDGNPSKRPTIRAVCDALARSAA